jgi:hypothetical protein
MRRDKGGKPIFPSENNKDILQVRCKVNGIPLRQSSTLASTYLVEPSSVHELATSFLIDGRVDLNVIELEWKKLGNMVAEWRLLTGNSELETNSSAHSISALADYVNIWHDHSAKDVVLSSSGVWQELNQPLTMMLNRRSTLVFGYALTVQPQVKTALLDRRLEYVQARLVVDGVPYAEGASIHGTSTWNPSSGTLTGTATVQLQAGEHSFSLQWKRLGNVFSAWVSFPTYLDGFAASRNLFVVQEKFNSPSFSGHQRQVFRATKGWKQVEGVLTVDLYKESAVLFKYSLPVTQRSHPQVDSNRWSHLPNMLARLVIDGLAYSQSTGVMGGSSKSFDSLFGDLALVLPAGKHSVSLEWQSESVDWQSIAPLDTSLIGSPNLLAIVSAENAKPAITVPKMLQIDGPPANTTVPSRGLFAQRWGSAQLSEDSSLLIEGLSVSDIDVELQPGVHVLVNISVEHGTLEILHENFAAEPYKVARGPKSPEGQYFGLWFNDTVGNINDALSKVRYHPDTNWNGLDCVVMELSDRQNVGMGNAKFDNATILLEVLPVDDVFTLDVPDSIQLQEGGEVVLEPFILWDIDSHSATFRVQVTASCGVFIFPNATSPNVTFVFGSASGQSAVDFYGEYHNMKRALEGARYVSASRCNSLQHTNAVFIRLSNEDNQQHTIIRHVRVEITGKNSRPEITRGKNGQRWTLSGLRILPSVDQTSADYVSTRLPARQGPDLGPSSAETLHFSPMKSSASLESGGDSAPLSGLTVLRSADLSYMFGLSYSKRTLELVGMKYVPQNRAVSVALRAPVEEPLPTTPSYLCRVFGEDLDVDTAYTIFPAHVSGNGTLVLCNITLLAPPPGATMATLWLQVINSSSSPASSTSMQDSDSDFESNFMALYSYPQPVVKTMTPSCRYESSRARLELTVKNAATIELCMFDDGSFSPASLGSHKSGRQMETSTIFCSAPPSSQASSVRVGSLDGAFLSESVGLRNLPNPTVHGVSDVSSGETNRHVLLAVHSEIDWQCLDTGSLDAIGCVLGNARSAPVDVNGSAVICEHYLDGPMVSFKAFNQSGRVTINKVPEKLDIYILGGSTEAPLSVDISSLTSTPNVNISCAKCAGLQLDIAGNTLNETVDSTVHSDTHFNYSIQLSGLGGISDIYTINVVHYRNPAIVPVAISFSGVADSAFWHRLPSSDVPSSTDNDAESNIQEEAELRFLRDSSPGNSTISTFLTLPNVQLPFSRSSQLQSISPPSGPLDGGVSVKVTGSGFSSGGPLWVVFGQQRVSATVTSDSELVCLSPAALEGSVVVTVQADDGEALGGSLSYLYAESVIVTGVSPYTGSTSGGSTVVVHGLSFVGTPSLKCFFDSVFTPASFVSKSRVECMVPPSESAGAVAVGVSLDGMTKSTTSATFTYMAPTVVSSLSPSSGSVGGGTNVTLTGSGFSYTSDLVCRFGTESSSATFVSDKQVFCAAPAHSVGSVPVSLFVNSVEAVVDGSALSFSYVSSGMIESIDPVVGSVSGGVSVKVTGSGFSSGGPLWVVFGQQRVSATVTSDSELVCLSPAVSDESVVLLSVIGTDFDELLGLPFSFVRAPVFYSFSPAAASIDGSTRLLIRGANLRLEELPVCVIGEEPSAISVVATILSSFEVSCSTPAQTHASLQPFAVILPSTSATLFSGNLTYVAPPAVASASLSREKRVAVLELVPGSTALSVHWQCYATGGDLLPSVRLQDEDGSDLIVCDLSGTAQSVTAVHLTDESGSIYSADLPLATEALPLALSNQLDSLSHASPGAIDSQPFGSDSPTSLLTAEQCTVIRTSSGAAPVANCVASATPSPLHLSDILAKGRSAGVPDWFVETATEPPRSLPTGPQPADPVASMAALSTPQPSVPALGGLRQTLDLLSHGGSCQINDQQSCISVELSASAAAPVSITISALNPMGESPDSMQGSSSGSTVSNRFTNPLVLGSFSPSEPLPFNSTLMDVFGKGFTVSTECSIRGAGDGPRQTWGLSTTFISSTQLECRFLTINVVKAWLVELWVVDRTSAATSNKLQARYADLSNSLSGTSLRASLLATTTTALESASARSSLIPGHLENTVAAMSPCLSADSCSSFPPSSLPQGACNSTASFGWLSLVSYDKLHSAESWAPGDCVSGNCEALGNASLCPSQSAFGWSHASRNLSLSPSTNDKGLYSLDLTADANKKEEEDDDDEEDEDAPVYSFTRDDDSTDSSAFFMALPTRFTVNSSERILDLFGSHLSQNQTWCLDALGGSSLERSRCKVSSFSQLRCEVPRSGLASPSGGRTLRLLADCTANVFNVTIEVFQPEQGAPSSRHNYTNIADHLLGLHYSKDLETWAPPVVAAAWPLALPTTGESAVKVTGQRLAGTTSCRFTLASGPVAHVPARVVYSNHSDDAEVWCDPPSAIGDDVALEGYAWLALSLDGNSWFELAAQIYLYATPELEYAFLRAAADTDHLQPQLQPQPQPQPQRHDVVVVGSLFPAALDGGLCSVGYADGRQVTVPLERLSISRVSCLGVSILQGKSRLVSLAVSLNDGANLHTVPNVQDLLTTDADAKAKAQASWPERAEPAPVAAPDVSAAQQATAVVLQRAAICDGATYLRVPVGRQTTSRAPYSCAVDGISWAAYLLSPDEVVCSVPSRPPGAVMLSVVDREGDFVAGQVVLVDLSCLGRPRVSGVSLLRQRTLSGVSSLQLSGLNLAPPGGLFCQLDNRNMVKAAADSDALVSCAFEAFAPGQHEVRLVFNEREVFFISVCLGEKQILEGAAALSASPADAQCTPEGSYLPKNPPLPDNPPRQLTAVLPPRGQAAGRTTLEVLGDGFAPMFRYSCLFNGSLETQSPALFISTNRLACDSPQAVRPATVSFGVVRHATPSAPRQEWVGASYTFVAPLRAVLAAPTLLSAAGGSEVELLLAGGDQDAEMLFCHFYDSSSPVSAAGGTGVVAEPVAGHTSVLTARIAGSSSPRPFVCPSPPVATRTVTVRVGSQDETWSNGVELAVAPTQLALVAQPARASLFGNSSIDVYAGGDADGLFLAMNNPVCLFGGTEALSSQVVHGGLLRCTSPASEPGIVELVVVEARALEQTRLGGQLDMSASPSVFADASLSRYAAGHFTFEAPAETAAVFPSSIWQNTSTQLMVQGTGFADSGGLVCFLQTLPAVNASAATAGGPAGSTLRLPAVWISSTLLFCEAPPLTLPGTSRLALRVSNNNGTDRSRHRLSLSLLSAARVRAVAPTRGYTLGGTPVTVDFYADPVGGTAIDAAVRCYFGKSATGAFRVAPGKYVCSAPAAAPLSALEADAGGRQVHVVVRGGSTGAQLHDFDFFYAAPPRFDAFAPAVLLAGKSSQLKVTGAFFSSSMAVRFRRRDGTTGTLSEASCTAESATQALCTVKPARTDSVLFLDASDSGADFATGLATIQVVPAVSVAGLADARVFAGQPGSLLDLHMAAYDKGAHSLDCVFTLESPQGATTSMRSPTRRKASDMATCAVPSLPPGTVLLSVEQAGHHLFGPVRLLVEPDTSVEHFWPTQLRAGEVTPLFLAFSTRAPKHMALHCVLDDGTPSVLRVLNLTHASCLVQPRRSGPSELVLRKGHGFAGEQGQGVSLGSIQVLDPTPVGAGALSLNQTFALAYAPSGLLVASWGCALPLGAVCVVEDRAVPSLASVSANTSGACSLACTLPALDAKGGSKAVLRVCESALCRHTYLRESLFVHSSVLVLAVNPSTGPDSGNTTVTLSGSGFSNQLGLHCLFGHHAAPVPALALSSSKVSCVTPKHPPGEVTVAVSQTEGFNLTASTIARFTFVVRFSESFTDVIDISALGGTVVTTRVNARALADHEGPFKCRFGRRSVLANKINETSLRCLAPATEYGPHEFAVTLEGADITAPVTMHSRSPPSVFFAEPSVVVAHRPTAFILLLDDMGFDTDLDPVPFEETLRCALGPVGASGPALQPGHLSMDGAVATCLPIAALKPGLHTLHLSYRNMPFFSFDFTARASALISRMRPLQAFTSQVTPVHMSVEDDISLDAAYEVCFGEHRLAVSVMGQRSLRFETPLLPRLWSANNRTISRVRETPLGLAVLGGTCEPTGFVFTSYAPPAVASVAPVAGPVTGGSVIHVTLSEPLLGDASDPSTEHTFPLFCRLGSQSHHAEMLDAYSFSCVTHAHEEGVVPLLVSANGAHFVPLGIDFRFEALAPTAAAPALPAVRPVLMRMEPAVMLSGQPTVLHLRGERFAPGAKCRSDADEALQTEWVSEGYVRCTVPATLPGKRVISVNNPGGMSTETKQVLNVVVVMPRVDATAGRPVYPAFGPLYGLTVITVRTLHTDAVVKALWCQVGEDFSPALRVEADSVQCVTGRVTVSGRVEVRLATEDNEFLPGAQVFEYIEDPSLFDVSPHVATNGTDVTLLGEGFERQPELRCVFLDIQVEAWVISDKELICTVPLLPGVDTYAVTLVTNGQQTIESGVEIDYFAPIVIENIWPDSGPALRGNTIVSVYGSGFEDVMDMECVFGSKSVRAVFVDPFTLKCRSPSSRPGILPFYLTRDGSRLSSTENDIEYTYYHDSSVAKVIPDNAPVSGGQAIFVIGNNFKNSTSLRCRFADMVSAGLYVTNQTIVCLAPSPIGRAELKVMSPTHEGANRTVNIEVSINGFDYSESRTQFRYTEGCDEGFYCPGGGRFMCPNGTFCPTNSRNFTLCSPGTFQPRGGTSRCLPCPVGWFCPDLGLSAPVICPAGYICHTNGLVGPALSCPIGHYCLPGTKAVSVEEFRDDHSGYDGQNAWKIDPYTGVATFIEDAYNWNYTIWPAPGTGMSRTQHPPKPSCDGLDCFPGSTAVVAEAPFPCPMGHYCRAGVGAQTPIPKNFSTPQRCFDGFFCPRGSHSPEGTGPCPTGYFCPTQLDALACPRGHYCPGVGNTGPIECYPGTYNPYESRSNCTVCPTGHICPGWGLLLPEPCPAGFVCAALGLSFPVVGCPMGYFCSDGTITADPSDTTLFKPFACNKGTFCLGGVSRSLAIDWVPTQPWGGDAPQFGNEGTFCRVGAYKASGTKLCLSGHFCPPKSSFPVRTPIGSFAAKQGSVAATLCIPGSYAPLRSQIDCLICPAGHTCQSYGTFIPSICPKGTFRSRADSVTCRDCPTGTYSAEVGNTDISLCLPCPQGRVCGTQRMYDLASSSECPEGYICGAGTDLSRQFAHKAPAGYHSPRETVPADMYKRKCQAGFYCGRGTPSSFETDGLLPACTIGYFCPLSTPQGLAQDIKCPFQTTTVAGGSTVNNCKIQDIDVCDKQQIYSKQPMQDYTYYPRFEYEALDGSGPIKFDSAISAGTYTGEIAAVVKVMPIDVDASSPLWKNETVEALRTCPSWGPADVRTKVTVIGRNFLPTNRIYCRVRACISADDAGSVDGAQHPRRCRNMVMDKSGAPLPLVGEISNSSFISKAVYRSPTRVVCEFPEYLFENVWESKHAAVRKLATTPPGNRGSTGNGNPLGGCHFVKWDGTVVFDHTMDSNGINSQVGNWSYVRRCDDEPYTCPKRVYPQGVHGAQTDSTSHWQYDTTPFKERWEFLNEISFACSAYDTPCPDKPEIGFMFNPCLTNEVIVEVSNDGLTWSGGDSPYSAPVSGDYEGGTPEAFKSGDLKGTYIPTTARNDERTPFYRNYQNYSIIPTVATYTMIDPRFMYNSPEPLLMEKSYCQMERYREEGKREREQGWFALESNQAAHIHADMSHLPEDMIYGEHYRFALFVQPSRCTEEVCNENRIRQTPRETIPCKLPHDFSDWFMDLGVDKRVKNNITVYGLDDAIFRFEIHILHGLYAAYGPFFENTTIVRIASPSRAVMTRRLLQQPTRRLSRHISYMERDTVEKFFFAVQYKQEFSESVSQPLNLPPTYKMHERGRVLVMYNASERNGQVPDVLDEFSKVSVGTVFWDLPAPTPDESKEMSDAYQETFHSITVDSDGQYGQGSEPELLLPYLPFFSNCRTFDSYIPLWMLFEDHLQCELPKQWPAKGDLVKSTRLKLPPLPDEDHISPTGPFDVLKPPIADYCKRDLQCNYEENIPEPEALPRFFEVGEGEALFYILKYPVKYSEYVGRSEDNPTYVGTEDSGGGKKTQDMLELSADYLIEVGLASSSAEDDGCPADGVCIPRRIKFEVAFRQMDRPFVLADDPDSVEKNIVYARLHYEEYDTDVDNTAYRFQLAMYPLKYFDLILTFQYSETLFMLLFVAIGAVTIVFSALFWIMCRLTTQLKNPPELRISAMMALTAPPPAAGVFLALLLTMLFVFTGNLLVNGVFLAIPGFSLRGEPGTGYLDTVPSHFQDQGWFTDSFFSFDPSSFVALDPLADSDVIMANRTGRIGMMFIVMSFIFMYASCKLFFCRKESNRDRDIAKLRDPMASKNEIWSPISWKKVNFTLASYMLAMLLVFIVEFSYSDAFGDDIYACIIALRVLGYWVDVLSEEQVQEFLLVMPMTTAFSLISGLVTFGAPDFLVFLFANFVEVFLLVFERVYLDVYIDEASANVRKLFNGIQSGIVKMIPKYLRSEDALKKEQAQAKHAERKREVEGLADDSEADSVEPIVIAYGSTCCDTTIMFYMPFVVYLLLIYRNEVGLPDIYGIKVQDMRIYFYFQVFFIPFQIIADVIIHASNELFWGWRIYEYLVYSRYRFLQRETRWKGMEDSLDECIEETFRTADQMCFSSQYYFMQTIHLNAVFFMVFGMEVMIRHEYNIFGDSMTLYLLALMFVIYVIFTRIAVTVSGSLGLWKIKHENTSWHLQTTDDDELDLPGWEDVKGASHDAYQMNQRITSETFRYKFMNYNRSWLINQLPQLLTPRTLRRSRPYLINQMARIIHARRDDISGDSEGGEKQFPAVSLTTSSRQIIRWWLGKARRRLRLRTIVDPLVRRARGAECEQCLSRRQLQVEYEHDIDSLSARYDEQFPGEDEVDQVQWKSFWTKHQVYHTICLSCSTKRKADERTNALRGAFDESLLTDQQEAYPEWGPVYLSAASKAMLLNWYRKAQRVRAMKRGRVKKQRVQREVSDDEGDETPAEWVRALAEMTDASKAIALFWSRTARANLQRKKGKGAGLRDSDLTGNPKEGHFISGQKSKNLRK